MLTGKRLACSNEANEYVTTLGEGIKMVLRLYNDGIAFRYDYPEAWTGSDPTVFRIPEGTRRWMEQWTDSYEGFFPLSTTYKVEPVPSFSGISKSEEGYNNRWGYPALLEPQDGLFVLLSEANIEHGQSASCLYNNKELFKVVPADRTFESPEGGWPKQGDRVNIVRNTPWRVAIIGCLADVVESTLITDVSNPSQIADTSWIQPGVVSWVYWAYNHGSNDYNIIKKYVDMAATLRLPYVLIDAEWDQMNMDYCLDLLESAARHHLLVNFHGATIPRGWQRTWPNLMSTEGVYGAEWYNNVPTFTDKAASHNATLPFTRNVIGPMDYTPCAFSDSQHPHITTHAHELALTVLFESGLQHLADKPESFLAQPQEVQDFLSHLPSVWDETRFLSGYPGESVVLARRSGDTWYIAGINGTDQEKELVVKQGDGSFVTPDDATKEFSVTAFLDAGEREWQILTSVGVLPEKVTCRPRGGFVYILQSRHRLSAHQQTSEH